MSKAKKTSPNASAKQLPEYGMEFEPGFFDSFVSDMAEMKSIVDEILPRCPFCLKVVTKPDGPATLHEIDCEHCKRCFCTFRFVVNGRTYWSSCATNVKTWMEFIALDVFRKAPKGSNRPPVRGGSGSDSAPSPAPPK